MQPNRHIDWFFSYPNFSHRMILSIVNRIYKHCAIVFIGCLVLGCSVPEQHDSVPINILILSGQNNHEWKKTTAALEKMYRNKAGFVVALTEDPEGLTYKELKGYDVVVGNWNNWPDNDKKMDPALEESFKKYVEEGGGIVFFHAGASSYYDSDIYHQIGIGRWGEGTSHGKLTMGHVVEFDQEHPVTRGLNDFFVLDELWENTDVYPGAKVLARVRGHDEDDGHEINENAVFVNEMGRGRCFYTLLGHNERVLFNTGMQTLLLRATEWVSTGRVTQEIPQDLKKTLDLAEDAYAWEETDTCLRLFNRENLVWQYNFRNRFGKPYFHPIYLKNSRITCESPTDHVWHYGLWFSWKFINGLNYWEYSNEFMSEETGYKSEGITDIDHIQFKKHPDHSTDIVLDIIYHPEDGDPILREKRKIYVSVPDEKSEYYFDYEHHFIAEYGDIILDRTPILGEPDGKSWGGYGGLSIRFNQDLSNPGTIPNYPPPTPPDYPKNDWFFMRFNSLRGEKVGVVMFQHPDYTTESTRWYFIINPEQPFFFFSPAALYDRKIELKRGDSLILKYRVWILSETDEDILAEKYHHYIYN